MQTYGTKNLPYIPRPNEPEFGGVRGDQTSKIKILSYASLNSAGGV